MLAGKGKRRGWRGCRPRTRPVFYVRRGACVCFFFRFGLDESGRRFRQQPRLCLHDCNSGTHERYACMPGTWRSAPVSPLSFCFLSFLSALRGLHVLKASKSSVELSPPASHSIGAHQPHYDTSIQTLVCLVAAWSGCESRSHFFTAYVGELEKEHAVARGGYDVRALARVPGGIGEKPVWPLVLAQVQQRAERTADCANFVHTYHECAVECGGGLG